MWKQRGRSKSQRVRGLTSKLRKAQSDENYFKLKIAAAQDARVEHSSDHTGHPTLPPSETSDFDAFPK